MQMIRFLHVIIGVTLAGAFVAKYFYLNLAIKEKNFLLLNFALRKSIFFDCILFLPAIMILFVTGSYQVIILNLSPKTPWIISAYLFFIFITLLWLSLFYLKSYNYILINKINAPLFKGIKYFHVANSLIIIFLIFITNDAVRKMTFIPWEKILR